MYIKMMGFNNDPLCAIYWHLNGQAQSRTVCYTEDDKKWALDRFNTVGDFYNNSYDAVKITYIDGTEEWQYRAVIEDVS